MMLGFATLRSKQYGEYQLIAIHNSEDSIKNHEYFLDSNPNSKSLQIFSSKELRRNPFVKESRQKNPLDCRFEVVLGYSLVSIYFTQRWAKVTTLRALTIFLEALF
jgi:hypothetical protein